MGERHPLPRGTRLGDEYVIEGVLGAGGFGITYSALDTRLEHIVAIKEYFPNQIAGRIGSGSIRWSSPADEETYRWGLDKFVKEARTLVRFRHPAIVRVLRIFPQNDTAYIVMEFVEGRDMEKWLAAQHGPPSQEELDALLDPLLDALAIVHKNRILHRDIKPANIYIRDNGQPVLLDFGSARPDQPEHSTLSSAVISRFYSPYEAYGTVPSQQGPWTDIYGLAATLCHALTGAPPPDALNRIADDEYRPLVTRSDLAARYRPRFLAALDKGLHVFPRDRPQTIEDWKPILFAGRPGHGASPLAPGASPAAAASWLRRAAAVAALALAAGALWAGAGTESGRNLIASLTGPAVIEAANDGGSRAATVEKNVDLEADRRRIALLEEEARRERDAVRREREDLERQRQAAEAARLAREKAEAEREIERIDEERRREREENARRQAQLEEQLRALEEERRRQASLDVRPSPPPVSRPRNVDPLSLFDRTAQPSFNCRDYSRRPIGDRHRIPQSDILCIEPEAATWDRQLGQAYSAARAGLDDADKRRLRDRQLEWIAERNVRCPASWSDVTDDAARAEVARCLIRVTQERTYELQ